MGNIDESGWCGICKRIKDGNADNCNGCIPGIPPSKFIKMREYKDEKKMIVTIIGSYSMKDKMLKVKDHFERFGNKVNCPWDEKRNEDPILTKRVEWIKKIEEADLVVVIPKDTRIGPEDSSFLVFSFGEFTSYEIAIASYFTKNIVVWGVIKDVLQREREISEFYMV